MTELSLVGVTRAVQYIRMSTDHQHYSIENQRTKIAEYANLKRYEIIDTYIDAGRSGLTAKLRQELSRLLLDVADPNRRFSTILVLDVSRWGRFQDPDQHAAYEFICRDMGVRVEYVAEPFDNDGSLSASLIKQIKRIMAGEYSRELSEKITYVKLRSAKRGHKQGGTLTYGLRRLLIDANGNAKQILFPGQQKSISDDRVVVVPGTIEEKKTVKNIFNMFINGASISSIARHLNFLKIPSTARSPWSFQKVRTILANELYTGIYVYNRASRKLSQTRVKNPIHLWVRVPVCTGIISKTKFAKTQKVLAVRNGVRGKSYSAQKMLDGLRKLWSTEGFLSSKLINDCRDVPGISTYRARFGNIENIFALLGYDAKVDDRRNRFRIGRNTPYSKAVLIAQLQGVLQERKYLSHRLFRYYPNIACPTTFAKAFGSVRNAFRAAGYDVKRIGQQRRDKIDENDALGKLKQLFDKYGSISRAILIADNCTPSIHWYVQKFGSFARACVRADIKYEPRSVGRLGPFRLRSEFLEGPECGGIFERTGSPVMPDEELFIIVRRIFAENGHVTCNLLNRSHDAPSLSSISKRYPSIADLYAAAGLPKNMAALRAAAKRRIKSQEQTATPVEVMA